MKYDRAVGHRKGPEDIGQAWPMGMTKRPWACPTSDCMSYALAYVLWPCPQYLPNVKVAPCIENGLA